MPRVRSIQCLRAGGADGRALPHCARARRGARRRRVAVRAGRRDGRRHVLRHQRLRHGADLRVRGAAVRIPAPPPDPYRAALLDVFAKDRLPSQPRVFVAPSCLWTSGGALARRTSRSRSLRRARRRNRSPRASPGSRRVRASR